MHLIHIVKHDGRTHDVGTDGFILGYFDQQNKMQFIGDIDPKVLGPLLQQVMADKVKKAFGL